MPTNTRPILVIEDDFDDQEIIKEIFSNLKIPNPVHLFSGAKEFIKYLSETRDYPFLIICDINLPIINGLELLSHISSQPHLQPKSYPFIFFTTAEDKFYVDKAYDSHAHGYFVKPSNFLEMQELLQSIILYWKKSRHPHT